MITAHELRDRARAQLGNKIFSNKWILLLAGCALIEAILGVSGYAVILPFILVGPAMIGLAYTFLKQVRNNDQPVDVQDFIYGVKGERIGKSVVLGFLYTIFTLLWTLLFVIPGIVKSYSYAMTPYIAIDHPEMEANDIITESRRMMNGHKFRLFCLDLSFIGWYIVGTLCLGIGILWVTPYHSLARANFYEDLINRSTAV